MLKLGHITYSNCFPPHAGIITGNVPFPFEMVEGIPSELNRLLFKGNVDVSPSSSIEYALNPGRYLLLPDMSITSKNRVMSILVESRVPLEDLDSRVVALTNASATSVVLLRILLELQRGIKPRYIHYTQGAEDPASNVEAILTIGDLALTKSADGAFPHRYDLGELWHQYTGLPFVFALWHVNVGKNAENELAELYAILKASKEYGIAHVEELALSQEKRFGVPAQVLREYWKSFSYDLGEQEQQGLLSFYDFAAQLGVSKTVNELHFWNRS